MPITKSAQKALRVSKRRNVINSKVRSQVKTTMEQVKKSPSGSTVTNAHSAIDIAVKKNLMHKNRAARLKSQVSRTSNKTASNTGK